MFGDDGGPWGGGETGGGGYPGGSSRRDTLHDDPGGWRNERGGNSTSVDPTGGTQSATVRWGSAPRNEFLGQLSCPNCG